MSRGFLLDTHTLLWWMFEAELLSSPSFDTLSEVSIDVFVSAVSAMEIATKHRKGHLPDGKHLVGRFTEVIEREGFQPLAVSVEHGDRAGFARMGPQGPVGPPAGGPGADRRAHARHERP